MNKFYYPTDDRNLKTKLFMQKSKVNCTNQQGCQSASLIKAD